MGNSPLSQADRTNQLVVLASGCPGRQRGSGDSCRRAGPGVTLLARGRIEHELHGFQHTYIAPARGTAEVNGHHLAVGDGIAAIDERCITVVAQEKPK